MGNKIYSKMGKVNKIDNMYNLAQEKSMDYDQEEAILSMNQELESLYDKDSRSIFYLDDMDLKSFVFLNYLHGIKDKKISTEIY